MQQQQQQQSPLHIPKVDSSHFFNINDPTPTKSNRQQKTATSRRNLRKNGTSPPSEYKQLQLMISYQQRTQMDCRLYKTSYAY